MWINFLTAPEPLEQISIDWYHEPSGLCLLVHFYHWTYLSPRAVDVIDGMSPTELVFLLQDH